jgi:lipid A ethanolaminephosphotransferase
VLSALTAHAMQRYGIYFNSDMLRNVLNTDPAEASELLTWGLLASPFLLAGPGLVLLARVRLTPQRLLRALTVRLGWLALSAVLAAACALLAFQDLSSLMRNHRELRHLITPGNLVIASATVVRDAQRAMVPYRQIGTDAAMAPRRPDALPRLVVLVVGETVRAQNWGLNGYARQTTPQLARTQAINFSDVSACGTSTEVSLPCMFSYEGRPGYDKARLSRSESLLHVIERAGIRTQWLDNQSGCKGVCAGLAFHSMQDRPASQACDNGHCPDAILLDALRDAIDRGNADVSATASPGDQFIVLHQIGNHGPAYYERIEERFRQFTPTCESSDLGDCQRAQIVNSYDNAILATDDMLARAISLLAAHEDRETALIYLSDHGESLGENNLYLHGLPYAIAPDTQTKVPMLVWLSPQMAASRGVDLACLRARASAPASHDNLFHSILGLLQISTAVHDSDLDLFAGCEAGPARASADTVGSAPEDATSNAVTQSSNSEGWATNSLPSRNPDRPTPTSR